MSWRRNMRRGLMAVGTQGASEAARAGSRAAGPDSHLGAAIGGAVGGPVGGYLGNEQDQSQRQQEEAARQQRRSSGVVPKAVPGGMSNYYDDSWGILQKAMQGGGGYEDAVQQLLANFKGKPGDLENFMRQAQPFLGAIEAGNLRNSAGYKHINDEKNWDMGAMGAYGPAAGQMAMGAQQGMQSGMAGLASRGLGRSAASASMRQMGQQQLGQDQSGLFQQLFQQSQQNRMRNADNALDSHRLVAQMALGQQITPRMQNQGGNMATIAGMAGGAGQLVGGLAALSDRRAKMDINRIGELRNGLPVYTFRYRPETGLGTRKRVGLMADEVERLHPKAVRTFKGLKHVDYALAVK